jgi:hypothetical protein
VKNKKREKNARLGSKIKYRRRIRGKKKEWIMIIFTEYNIIFRLVVVILLLILL